MNFDYEADLNRLKEAQKQSAMADLEKQRNQSLSDLDAEEKTIKPTYYKKKDSANVQNQVAAKNFHEYLVNSGRSNSGIGAQYEMLRQNSLQRSLNDLNTAEANALSDVARRRTDVNNAYNSGLTSANAQIEADYITNLLAQRQAAWEREMQQKQYEESVRQFNEQMALERQNAARSYASSGSSGRSSGSGYATGAIAYGTIVAQEGDGNGNIIYQTSDGQTYKMKVGYNPYTGRQAKNAEYGTFSNGYQPNNLGKDSAGNVKRLKSSGKTVGDLYGNYNNAAGVNVANQTVWEYGGHYYVWDGAANEYIDMGKKK